MYSACIPTLIYAFFGQSRQLAVGPVAMVSLLVEAGLNGQLGPECTVEGKPQYEARRCGTGPELAFPGSAEMEDLEQSQ